MPATSLINLANPVHPLLQITLPQIPLPPFPMRPHNSGLRTHARFCHRVRVGISPKQFEQLQNRVRGAARRPTATPPEAAPAPTRTHEIILGVDPSLRGTGYGVIRMAKPHPVTLAQGTIHCPAGWERSRCLALIHTTLRDLIRTHQPTVCIVEGLFFAQNLQTAIIMGEARGAALVAMAEAGLEIFEVAPRKVKQAIVGYGAAQKIAVAKMVQRMLQLAELPEPDAADALALALTHAQTAGRYSVEGPKRI
ncbi:MAG: crossover junction endodeoxyribonuclease RuvC [Proteobacteria bacterium]|nr:crossover junction endodeoxyribonuclease RuvC [Pseudomonadota bacterium]